MAEFETPGTWFRRAEARIKCQHDFGDVELLIDVARRFTNYKPSVELPSWKDTTHGDDPAYEAAAATWQELEREVIAHLERDCPKGWKVGWKEGAFGMWPDADSDKGSLRG